MFFNRLLDSIFLMVNEDLWMNLARYPLLSEMVPLNAQRPRRKILIDAKNDRMICILETIYGTLAENRKAFYTSDENEKRDENNSF